MKRKKKMSVHISIVPWTATGLKGRGLEPCGPELWSWACLWLVPKWDCHLGTLLNNLYPHWNDWWAGIRWQCRVEWSRVESRGPPISGSAPVVPWFISTAPQSPQGGDLSVSRLCVQEDELGLQTHHTKTLSLAVVLSLSLLHSSLPAVQLSLFSLLY